MGTTQFKLGKRHGYEKVKMYSHRNGKLYSTELANDSYRYGYAEGMDERLNKEQGNDRQSRTGDRTSTER